MLSRVVLLLSAAAFCTSVASRICDPLLPRLADEFGVGLGSVAWVIGVFAIAYGVLQLAIGPISDRFGKYTLVSWAMVFATLAALACALAPTLGWLLLGRALMGGIAGAVTPVSFAWIGDVLPIEERQPVLARVMGGNLLGMMSGQLVGGVFVDAGGWRMAFVALAAMCALVAVLMVLARKALPPALPGRPLRSPVAMARDYVAIARPPWPRRVLLTVGAEGMLMFGALAFVPSMLHERFALPLWQASLVAALVGAGGFAYTLLARRLLERVGARGIAVGGAIALSLGLLLLALAPAWWVVGIACLGMGLGFYSFHNTLQVHGTQLSSTQRGMGMALFALCLFVGQSIGVAIVSAMIGHLGYGVAFGGAGLAFGALALVYLRALARRETPLVD